MAFIEEEELVDVVARVLASQPVKQANMVRHVVVAEDGSWRVKKTWINCGSTETEPNTSYKDAAREFIAVHRKLKELGI